MDMTGLSQEILPLIQTLIPGFLMTMSFYWFAEVPKPSQFERTLQALVGTAVIQALLYALEHGSYLIGHYISFGVWSSTASNVAAMLVGVAAGLYLAYCCNNDLIYSFARKLKLTTKASTEDSIHVYQKYGRSVIVRRVADERRLMGYFGTFPNNKEGGMFLIEQPSWVHSGNVVPCTGAHAMLVHSSDVRWVEFLEDAADE